MPERTVYKMNVPVSLLDSSKHLDTPSKHPSMLARGVIRHCRELRSWSGLREQCQPVTVADIVAGAGLDRVGRVGLRAP
jgi:hypothetical protein